MRTLANLAGFARGRADRLFGYDFFISYAHDDGADYPRELAKRLRERQFTVFLDEEVYVGGTDLPSATRRRVRMSNKLVVVGRPHVLTSTWVLKEVDESLAAEREPIVIDVDGSWAAADGANPLKQRIGERIYLTEEPPGAVLPSPRVVDDLARSYDATRKEIVRRYTLTAALAAFLVILFIAAWQLREARLQSRTAAATRAENLFRAMSLAGREDDFEPEPLLLACRAVAAAPRGDPRLPAYSLHAFYEGLKQPIGVAQLPRRVQWSVFRPDFRQVVTFSEDDGLEVWELPGGRRIAKLDFDPNRNFAKVYKPGLFDAAGRRFRLTTTEAIFRNAPHGYRSFKDQSWDTSLWKRLTMPEPDEQALRSSFSRSTVAELETLRNGSGTHERGGESSAAKTSRIVARSDDDRLIISVERQDEQEHQLWEWRDNAYHQLRGLPPGSRTFQFLRVGGVDVLAIVSAERRLTILEIASGRQVAAPIVLPKIPPAPEVVNDPGDAVSWTLAPDARLLGVVDSTGRVWLCQPRWDPGVAAAAPMRALRAPEPLLRAIFSFEGTSALVTFEYSPTYAETSGIGFWNVSDDVLRWRKTKFDDFPVEINGARALAVAPGGQRAAVVGRPRESRDDPSRAAIVFLKLPEGTIEHVPRAPSIVISHNSYGVQFEKHLRFLSNERLLYPVVTPARSYSIEPLDRGWELRIFDLTREREETVPSVRAVPPTHSLLCYTKDGAHFVTYSHYDKTLAIWPIAAGGASLRLRRIRPEHLASYAAIFRQASRVRAAEPDTVAADLADGVTISIAPAGVTARREGETWRISALPPAVAEEKSLREPQQELTPDGRLWVVHGSAYVEWPDKAPGWLGIRDVSTGVAVARWLWHDSHVIGTTFLDEGRQLVTVAASGTVRRWFLDVAADDDRIRLSNAGEALTGMRIGDAGIASPLPPTELAAVREAEPRTAAERLLHARLRITLRP